MMNRPFAPAAFLLPSPETELTRFSVVACDQYTSEPEIWCRMDRFVGSAPSALRLILPEAFLSEAESRIPAIHRAMADYLSRGLLKAPFAEGMILTERVTSSGTRPGLVLTVDLEQYDYTPGSRSLIRPTEGTVTERIPPRLAIRRGAPLEMSHILLLCDDPEESVIEPLYAMRSSLPALYDFSLQEGGGCLRGWAVCGETLEKKALPALDALLNRTEMGGILFAVGDGNHSLATAKAYWEELKKSLPPDQIAHHPARYAMAELTNIYAPALRFAPIHRVLYGKSVKDVLSLLAPARPLPDAARPDAVLISGDGEYPVSFSHPLHPLPVGTVQNCLDSASGLRVDYIHGEETLRRLSQSGACGILLPAMDKSALFPSVTASGPLPRKTFSMGEAQEKRYYLEARVIA